MKNIIFIAGLLFGLSVNAQVNPNVTKETKTTKVTVNDGSKPKTIVKTEKKATTQDIQLKDADSKKLNKDIAPTPVQVNSSTTVSGDGIPTQEINRTSYYTLNGTRYHFVTDNSGYKITTPDNVNYARIRKTSNNNYIIRSNDKTSVGYFNADGNFVVETYDDKTDNITVETYTRVP